MGVGLQVADANGNITFDSDAAVGGVYLGTYVVPTNGATFYFPAIEPYYQGSYSVAYGNSNNSFSFNNNSGYPIFTFSGGIQVITVSLYLK